MGNYQSKKVDSTGVVINEIELIETPKTTNILLIILVVIAVAEVVYNFIQWHRNTLKRKYLKRAISTEQV